MSKNVLPKVSVILPIYNEKSFIRECLNSLAMQDILIEDIEVLIIDGISDDGTRKIVREFISRYPWFRLLDNPERDTISALNLGIQTARGEFIIRVDGHTILEPDYVSQCIKSHKQTDAACVGGLMRPIGRTYVQQAVALATSTPFGVGTGKFHYSNKESYVDTVYLGAFPKRVFKEIGRFDPEMKYSEDNDFNYRILASGGKIFLTPKIKSWYLPRSSLGALFKQYFNYGFHKLNFFLKHNQVTSVRHLAPSIFLSMLVITSFLSIFGSIWLFPLMILVSSYLLVSFIAGAKVSGFKGIKYLPFLPVVFATLHCSYGLGFIMNCFLTLLGCGRTAVSKETIASR